MMTYICVILFNLGFNPCSLQTKTDTFANSVDTEDMAPYGPFCFFVVFLLFFCCFFFLFCFVLYFLTGSPICDSGHVQIQSSKRPL